MIQWDPGGRSRQGILRSKWLKQVEEDLRRIRIVRWNEKTGDRTLWRKISEKMLK